MTVFFPNAGFALVFAGVLLAGLAVAAWIDLKTLRVPKPVTLGLAAAGLLLNAARAAWLGADGCEGWMFSDPGVLGGLFEGALFSLGGLVVGFAVFFALWVFNVCGGGDVKLGAAVGAWVGPKYFFFVLILALPVLVVFTLAKLVLVLSRSRSGGPSPLAAPPDLQWRLMSYSLPMALAVLGMFLIGFRAHLGLA
jgi:prepilin peptidase CpaA